jgi:hypothetical protein
VLSRTRLYALSHSSAICPLPSLSSTVSQVLHKLYEAVGGIIYDTYPPLGSGAVANGDVNNGVVASVRDKKPSYFYLSVLGPTGRPGAVTTADVGGGADGAREGQHENNSSHHHHPTPPPGELRYSWRLNGKPLTPGDGLLTAAPTFELLQGRHFTDGHDLVRGGVRMTVTGAKGS